MFFSANWISSILIFPNSNFIGKSLLLCNRDNFKVKKNFVIFFLVLYPYYMILSYNYQVFYSIFLYIFSISSISSAFPPKKDAFRQFSRLKTPLIEFDIPYILSSLSQTFEPAFQLSRIKSLTLPFTSFSSIPSSQTVLKYPLNRRQTIRFNDTALSYPIALERIHFLHISKSRPMKSPV